MDAYKHLEHRICIVFCLLLTSLAGAQIVHYSVPESIPSNDDYTVRVKTPGQAWQDLFEYDVVVDMHNRRHASMVYFDFSGEVEVEVTKQQGPIDSARIRPSSCAIMPQINNNTIRFRLTQPCNLSVEVNGNIFNNLHVFTNPIESDRPDPNDPNVMYFGPGLHTFEEDVLDVPSGKTLYLAGGALVKAKIRCQNAQNVRIGGRGIIYQSPSRGIELVSSSNISISDLILINPKHYTVYGGQSRGISIQHIRSFSSEGWSDGIDLMSCSDVQVDGVFMRNSDDCIALYTHRWDHYGDVRNITIQNSVLWADVAHPIMIGTHGNPEDPEVIEHLVFKNLDILNHDEPQIGYQGSLAINVSDENLVRDVRFENIRVDDFEQGQLINLRVVFNKKYATAPGRGIENILFKNITYNGSHASTSVISGYNEDRAIKDIVFENLKINGQLIWDDMPGKPGYFATSDVARFYIGPHVEGLKFIRSTERTIESIQNSSTPGKKSFNTIKSQNADIVGKE